MSDFSFEQERFTCEPKVDALYHEIAMFILAQQKDGEHYFFLA